MIPSGIATTIYDQGNWQKPTKKVEPGVPRFCMRCRSAGGSLDVRAVAGGPALADDRARGGEPGWQSMFGMGLVETAEDFGVRSGDPTHPELLDWLAVGFMEGALARKRPPWVKQLVRTIVLSSTYRQDSRASEALLNVIRATSCSLGPRFRAEAEVVRDIAHGVGPARGKSGRPQFYPPVPESLFA